MNKRYALWAILILFSRPAYCGQPLVFATADSLFINEQYLRAIEEYSRLLNSEKADYALYKIGLCKNEIGKFCVSRNQFAKYPNNYQKHYGKKYVTYLEFIKYIEDNPQEFRYFEPEAIYVSQGHDFIRIIGDYPKSEYVDNSAYELLLQSRHIDWEGDYRDMLPCISRCKAFLEEYPDSDVRDKVIDLCLQDYSDIIFRSWKLPDYLKTKYEGELMEFKKHWGLITEELKN